MLDQSGKIFLKCKDTIFKNQRIMKRQIKIHDKFLVNCETACLDGIYL